MDSSPPNPPDAAFADVVRVLIVDDQETVRSALTAFMFAMAEFESVGEASNGQEAVRLSEELQPDVVLMDLVMPVMDGIEATRIVRERWPQIKVIALTSYEDERLLSGVVDAGAHGVLFKDLSASELAEDVLAIHAGRPLPPRRTAHNPGDPAPPST